WRTHTRAASMADDGDGTPAHVPGERGEVGRHGLGVVARRRLARVAEAAQVWRDHGEVAGEQVYHVAPLVPGLRPAVQQHDGPALTGPYVVQPGAVGGGGVVFQGVRRRHGDVLPVPGTSGRSGGLAQSGS